MCLKIWLKYKLRLPTHVWFYTENVCQMQKIRMEVRANIITHANACKVAWLAVDNWGNKTTGMANNNKEAEIDFTNVELVKFGI